MLKLKGGASKRYVLGKTAKDQQKNAVGPLLLLGTLEMTEMTMIFSDVHWTTSYHTHIHLIGNCILQRLEQSRLIQNA